MRIRRLAILAAFAAGLASLPISAAQAQYYAPCSPFPLAWPFCAAGAIVGTAATIATAPFWALSGAPYYGYYPPPYYPAPSYYAPAYYPPPAVTYAPPPAAAPQPAPGASVPPPPKASRPASYGPPPAGNAYYYCPASKRYYPYVASCAVPWRPIPTTPPHASR